MPANSKTMSGKIIGFVVIVVIIGGLIWIAQPESPNAAPTIPNGNSNAVSLKAEETTFDFGRISMAAGPVRHTFVVTNPSSETITIEKIYTSCMCTTATLKLDGQTFGPFGMPGHGSIPSLNQAIAPSQEIVIEAEFDPAAHGPAGIGQIDRSIIVKTSAGQPLELRFKTFVTP